MKPETLNKEILLLKEANRKSFLFFQIISLLAKLIVAFLFQIEIKDIYLFTIKFFSGNLLITKRYGQFSQAGIF